MDRKWPGMPGAGRSERKQAVAGQSGTKQAGAWRSRTKEARAGQFGRKQVGAGPSDINWRDELIVAGLLIAAAFLINRGIAIKGLYMDDLYLWSCYGEQTFWEFVFPIGSTRFRFIYYLAAWLELAVVGSYIGWFVPINILLNSCIAYTVYRFGKKLSGKGLIGLWCGFLYLVSRMSYYQIGQVYGLMESLALWAAIGIFYCLFQYFHEKETDGGIRNPYLLRAEILYFCICFIHERYMVLLPLFYLVFVLRKEKKASSWLSVTGVFAAVQAIRLITIGTIAPAGTGGTDVMNTFHPGEAIRYALDQVLYIFGVNAGPEHLNGCSFNASLQWVRVSVIVADLLLVILVIMFLARLVKDGRRLQYMADASLFLVFIALCIGSSSVTIRVEMRWVYGSLTAAYLFAAWLYGVLTSEREGKNRKGVESIPLHRTARRTSKRYALVCGGLFLCYFLIMVPVEGYYREQFPNIYLWPNQMRYNSLAEETYEKYGDEIFGKKIYIIGNSYEMSDFTARTFFKTFDRERKAEGTEVQFIDSIYEIGQVAGNMLLLQEDPKHNAYQDITEFVRALKCETAYGFYEDGWMDESAKIRVMTGESGRIEMEFYYPGELTGTEVCHITLGDGTKKDVVINADIVRAEIEAQPAQIVEMTFENNFYYKDAMEQRGEKRFSMLMTIQTD